MALFAGAGGGIWGSRLLGWQTVCYVEIDPYCQRVLQARIADGYFDDAPIWDDIRTFDGRPWRGHVDIITAGFPCQPFSAAGTRTEHEYDPRNLWPETIRGIREVRPPIAFLENSPALLATGKRYFGRILADVAAAGFDARWVVLGADDIGAPHHRKRLWILVSDADRKRLRSIRRQTSCGILRPPGHHTLRIPGIRRPKNGTRSETPWRTEPSVDRVVARVADWRNRLRALGNGQVPAVAATAWRILTDGI